MWREKLNVCLKCFYTCTRKMARIAKLTSSVKSTISPPSIDQFLRTTPHNKPFPTSSISDQTNKLLEHLKEASGKQASALPAALSIGNQFPMGRWGNCSTKSSWDRPRAKIPHSYRGRHEFYRGLFFDRRGRENQRQFWPYEKHSKHFSLFELKQSKPARKSFRVTSGIPKMNVTLTMTLTQTVRNSKTFKAMDSWKRSCREKVLA